MAETTTGAELATLVQEGNAALLAGDTVAARQRFRQALEIDPQHAPAWVGLAGAVRPYREKREHLRKALAINPAYAEAEAALAHVEARLAAGEVLAPGGAREAPRPAPEPEPAVPAAPPESETLFCYNHPGRETGLRCTNCGRPICAECIRPAAVGQLCPECAKIRRPVNYQVGAALLAGVAVLAFILGLGLTFAALWVLGLVRFFGFILAFLLGPAAGELIVRVIDRITRGKRGRGMQLALSIGYGLGSALLLTPIFFFAPLGGLAPLLFTVLVVTTVVARMR